MVVHLPQLPGETMASCTNPECGAMGLRSAVKERSAFYATNKARTRFQGLCRRCAIGKMRGWQRRNPEWRELERIDLKLEAERRGRPLPSLEEVCTNRGCGEMVDARPFQRWLRRVIDRADGSQEDVAAMLRVQERQISRWFAAEKLDIETVERALAREGSTMLWELYENYKEEVPVTEEAPVIELKRQCGTLGCPERVAHPERFCPPHKAFYARVREELTASSTEFRSNIGKPKPPRCCNPACSNSRLRGERYCMECQDAGWSEEEIA